MILSVTWHMLVMFALGIMLGWGVAQSMASRRWWRRGFEDHKRIVERVWGAETGWVDYAKRAEKARAEWNRGRKDMS